MGANKQVFGSNPERTNYYKLSRQWGEKYRIYHNLPFLNVFNMKGLINPEKVASGSNLTDPTVPTHLTIDDADFNRLKKTSIDYTLCSEDDRPLLCIEFDGLKDGFNVGIDYRFDGPPDPWRELITGLKLRVAHGSMFPFFVVGYKEFKDLAENVELTMIDGIIGEVLSAQEARNRFGKGFQPEEAGWSPENFDNLTPTEQQEVVQDWVIGVEVEAEFTHNPISVRVAELERELPVHCSCTWLSYPDADVAKTVAERAKMLENTVLNGCRCSLLGGDERSRGKSTSEATPSGPISATVWLPNFKTPGIGSMLGLVENLSKLISLEKAKKKIQQSK